MKLTLTGKAPQNRAKFLQNEEMADSKYLTGSRAVD